MIDVDGVDALTDFEALISEGLAAADSLDAGRWTLGRLAKTVKTEYGKDKLGQFAKEIDVEPKRLREYRQVWAWCETSAPEDYRRDNPMLRYSHYRLAMRLPADQALAFLDECSANAYTVGHAGVIAAKMVGKPVAPAKREWDITTIDAERYTTNVIHLRTPDAPTIAAFVNDHRDDVDFVVKLVIQYTYKEPTL